jgi:hypothetical protein
MFDRVYSPLRREVPQGYRWIEGSPDNLTSEDMLAPPDIPIEFSFGSQKAEAANSQSKDMIAMAMAYHGLPDHEATMSVEQSLESSYARQGVMGTWCTSNRGLYLERFSKGETVAHQGALNNIPIVEAGIGWDEVIAFREDRDSVAKYRDLRLWLKDGLGAQSEQHATDLIAQRIEDYRWAIRKHGLRTASGALSNLWDWKQSAALVAGVGAAATLGAGAIAALVAGLAISSGVGAFFLERRIDAVDVRRGAGREVAILVEIQDRFGSRPDRDPQ